MRWRAVQSAPAEGGWVAYLRALAIVLAFLSMPFAAEAQQAGRVYRIGILTVTPGAVQMQAFRQGLRDLGWIEGQNIVLEHRYYQARFERLPELAAELVRLNVDVIVASTAPDTGAAMQATKTIPIVFLAHGDPLVTGHVASLAKPGGNVTGLTLMQPELSAKRLELLKEVLPRDSHVAVLWNPANAIKASEWRETQAAARALGVSLQSREVRGPNDFEKVFTAMTTARPGALLTLDDPLIYAHRTTIPEFATKERLPTMHAVGGFAHAGALMTYGVDTVDTFRRGATYVDKILRGAKPSELPVQQATKLVLTINLRTAKALGVTMPPSLLLRANDVIQ